MEVMKNCFATACMMLYLILLVCLLLEEADCHDMQCRSKNECDSDSSCCESLSGKRWCCPRIQRCCSKGCCPVNATITKLFHYESNNHSYDERNFVQDNLSSKDHLSTVNSPKSRKQTNCQKCDDEGMFFCDRSETCCSTGESWMCCPYANYSSCNDQNNCHPSKTKCDTSKCTECNSDIKVPKYAEKKIQKPSSSPLNTSRFILCPDEERVCLDTDTCCRVSSLSYGCCPYEDAVCCTDFEHCCPPDTVCNLSTLACDPPETNSESRALFLRFLYSRLRREH